MKTFAFIDASNLFYGGVELHKFSYDYLKQETVPINELENYLTNIIKNQGVKMNEAKLILMERHLQRVRFYKKLEKFGYRLFLKPIKLFIQEDGEYKRKANCDVDMAFLLMKEKENFDRVLILSRDGDFLPVLKYLKSASKEVIILARGNRTAREIRQLAGSDFRDFVRLKKDLEFEEK